MNQKFKYLFKNVGILTLSNFSSKVLSFLLVPLYTSILSTGDYGIYDLSVSTMQLLYPLLTVNIVDAVMRFTMDKKYDKGQVASIGLEYILTSVIVASGIIFVLGYFNLIPSYKGLWILILLYYITYTVNQYFIQLAKGLERIKLMGITGIAGTVVMLGANLLLLLVFRMGLRGFYIAHILAIAVPIIWYFFGLKFWTILKRPENRKRLNADMVKYSAPLIFTTIGWWANNSADKYVVTFLCGLSANGLLSVSYKIPQILNVVQGIFIQAWQVSAIKEYEADDARSFYGKTFVCINLLFCLLCGVLILLNKFLASLLYAKDFYAAWQYVPFFLVSSVLNTASGFIGPILSAKKDSISMAKSAVIGTSANIVMNIILVYFIGIQGAAISTAISSFIIYYVRYRKVRDMLMIRHYWRVLSTWLVLCLQAIVAIYLKMYIVQILLIGIILLLNVDILKMLMNSLKSVFARNHA